MCEGTRLASAWGIGLRMLDLDGGKRRTAILRQRSFLVEKSARSMTTPCCSSGGQIESERSSLVSLLLLIPHPSHRPFPGFPSRVPISFFGGTHRSTLSLRNVA